MKVSILWQLARPRTLVVIWMHAILGYVTVTGDEPNLYKLIIGLTVTLLAYICAVAINDLADEEVDGINLIHQNQDSDRPIINKSGSRKTVTFIAYITGILTIVLALFLDPFFGIFASVMVALNAIYSLPPLQISKHGGLAQLLLPLMYVVFPMCAGLIVSGKGASTDFCWLMVGFYGLFAGRLFLKDIRDEIGDRKVGKLTYLVRHGLRRTLYHSGIWSIVGIALTALVAVHHINIFIILVVAITVMVGIVYGLVKCHREEVLDTKLLYVAIIGRYASMWTLFIVISLALTWTNLPYVKIFILQLLTLGIFMSGIVMLHEELPSKAKH